VRIFPGESNCPSGVMVSILLVECVCMGLSSHPDTVPILRRESVGKDDIYVMQGHHRIGWDKIILCNLWWDLTQRSQGAFQFVMSEKEKGTWTRIKPSTPATSWTREDNGQVWRGGGVEESTKSEIRYGEPKGEKVGAGKRVKKQRGLQLEEQVGNKMFSLEGPAKHL
jgi:hypothetical protein